MHYHICHPVDVFHQHNIEGVSNHREFDCLINILGWQQRKNQSSTLSTLCVGNPSVTSGFPSPRASNSNTTKRIGNATLVCRTSLQLLAFTWHDTIYVGVFNGLYVFFTHFLSRPRSCTYLHMFFLVKVPVILKNILCIFFLSILTAFILSILLTISQHLFR